MVPRNTQPEPKGRFRRVVLLTTPLTTPLAADASSIIAGRAAAPRDPDRARACRRDAHALLETDAMLCIFALRSGSNAIATQQCTIRNGCFT